VDLHFCRYLSIDGVEETDELLMPMAPHISADDRAVEHIEGGEQRGCAMALVCPPPPEGSDIPDELKVKLFRAARGSLTTLTHALCQP
jgi:hypothetical protein